MSPRRSARGGVGSPGPGAAPPSRRRPTPPTPPAFRAGRMQDRSPAGDARRVRTTQPPTFASAWPAGMRVIVRRKRPHPGAQLRTTDRDGLRYTAFATNTCRGGPAASSLTSSSPPSPGPRRGPHPRRERHRPDQPAPARDGPEPDLAGHRHARLRDHHLDSATRLHRAPRPALGTQTAAPPTVLPCGCPKPCTRALTCCFAADLRRA
jgi:hypothetical protein